LREPMGIERVTGLMVIVRELNTSSSSDADMDVLIKIEHCLENYVECCRCHAVLRDVARKSSSYILPIFNTVCGIWLTLVYQRSTYQIFVACTGLCLLVILWETCWNSANTLKTTQKRALIDYKH
jgi:hypothetical protein